MEESDLINFNNDNYVKITSPLIPLPIESEQFKYIPRLSDCDNNPFDKVLRNTATTNDPFDFSYQPTPKKCFNISENKENISSLISPFKQTPSRSRKSFKSSNSINENVQMIKKNLERVYSDGNTSILSTQDELNNSSLQFLNESVFNTTNFDKDGRFDGDNIFSPENGFLTDIKNCITPEDDHLSPKTVENQSPKKNIENINYCSPVAENHISPESYICGISKITLSSCASYASSTLDKAFVGNTIGLEPNTTYVVRRQTMSATKAQRPVFNFDINGCKRKLSNSFNGFNSSGVGEHIFNECDEDIFRHDCITKEINKKKNKGDCSLVQQAIEAECNLDLNKPPWENDESVLILDDNDNENYNSPEDIQIEDSPKDIHIVDSPKDIQIESSLENIQRDSIMMNNNENIQKYIENEKLTTIKEKIVCDNFNPEKTKTDDNTEKVKNLLQSLTDILQCSGSEVDKRQLGENLINSITLAFNINKNESIHESPIIKETVKKSDNKNGLNHDKLLKPKNKLSSIKNLPLKLKNVEKNLKIKADKEKPTNKGPLKAVMPVRDFLKSKKPTTPRNSTFTPTKLNLKNKSNTSITSSNTPLNRSKLTSPLAQSTPNTIISTEDQIRNQCPTTPTRSLAYIRSLLKKPSSSTDLNKSTSPSINQTSNSRTSTGSLQNLSNDKSMNTSIPTTGRMSLLRRKSASDIKTNNNILKNAENGKISTGSRLPTITRSSSFQNRSFKK